MAEARKLPRLTGVDAVRGAVIVLMLLDHTRDFVHRGAQLADPLDLETTTPALFLTRWVTHLCAPTFVFLAGVSARLQLARGASERELSKYLTVRGALLIALELLVLRPLIFFNFNPYLLAFLQVIWALGVSMVVLAGLVHAKRALVALFGCALVLLHNTLDGLEVSGSPWRELWIVLHGVGSIPVTSHGIGIHVQYALVPWIGVMALGFVFGVVFTWDASRRRRACAWSGVASLALFAVLRATRWYGDPQAWQPQVDRVRSCLAFLDVEKYPPSLQYLCVTLGIALCALALLDGRSDGALARPLVELGRVPLFFYVLQWPTVHCVAMLLQALDGQPVGWQTQLPWTRDFPLPDSWGFSLTTTYVAWAIGLSVLYPLCLWFGAFKRDHPERRWLGYL